MKRGTANESDFAYESPVKSKILNNAEIQVKKNLEYKRYTEILKECKIHYKFGKQKITFLISCSWLNLWLDYVDGDGTHPGEIDNRALWHAIFNKKEVKRKEDFYIIDKKVWALLHQIYSGGPILHKEKKEVNFETVSVNTSITSFDGTNYGYVVSDTVSQSEFSVVNRVNSLDKKSPFENTSTNITNYKQSSFISNHDSENWSVGEYKTDNYFKGQSGHKQKSSVYENIIAELPHEEDNERFPESRRDVHPKVNNNYEEEEIEEEEEECEQEESEMSASNCEFNIIGLKNPNNFWYMNVCLQALLSVGELVEYYLKIDPNELLRLSKVNKKKENISYIFASFWHDALIEERDDAYNPASVQDAVKKIFSTQMQDSHEFFLYFFSKLQDEENKFKMNLLKSQGLPLPIDPDPSSENNPTDYWEKYREGHSSIIDRLFWGLMSSSVVRKWCSKVTKNYEPFLDLSWDIKSDSVMGCLKDYFADEKIGTEFDYKCDDCKTTTKAIIRKRIEKLPQNLIIHLKRFEYPSLKKDRALIDYKHVLDVSKFMGSKEEGTLTKYNLFGMIIHKGKEMDRGHYISLFKREKQWYEFDDDKVYEIQGKDNTKYVLEKQIYMLLYKREV